jgi:hypothetical protein
MDMHIHGTAQASTGWELWFFLNYFSWEAAATASA